MSFLEQLNATKTKLKPTSTTVTQADGKRTIETNTGIQNQIAAHYGFVIDTSPDQIPALIIPNLYLGSQDCCTFEVLIKYQIESVLSIGIEPFQKYENIKYKFVECLDLPETNIVDIIRNNCLLFIQNNLDKNKNVLIHCNAGCSRSPTVIIGYLMINLNYQFDDAYQLVKTARPCIQPNPGFLKQLQNITTEHSKIKQ